MRVSHIMVSCEWEGVVEGVEEVNVLRLLILHYNNYSFVILVRFKQKSCVYYI